MKMKNILLILLLKIVIIDNVIIVSENENIKDKILSTYTDGPKKELFKVYHFLYNKNYSLYSDEGIKRYKIFKQNLKVIDETNKKNLSYKLGIGPFTDLSNQEFKDTYIMSREITDKIFKYSNRNFKLEKEESQFTKINWISHFGPVLNQSKCGACYAFASTGAMEAAYSIQFNEKITLSQQQIVDCNKFDNGCKGGYPTTTFGYLKEKGISYASAYPYISGITKVPGTCKYDQIRPNFILDDYEVCPIAECTKLRWRSMLAKGPLVVGFDAEGNISMKDYKGGIIDMVCSNMNHAVVVHSMDKDDKGIIYGVRNSWGEDWGENGNFKIRQKDDLSTCFMEFTAWRPIMKKAVNPVPIPVPEKKCTLLYDKCNFEGKEVEICETQITLSTTISTISGFRIGIFKKITVFTDLYCRGTQYSFFIDEPCFSTNDMGFLAQKIKSIVIEKDSPPIGCIWVFDGACLTEAKETFCNDIPDLNIFNFSNRISSIKLGPGVASVKIFEEINYNGDDYEKNNDLYVLPRWLDNSLKSIKIIKK